MFGVGSVARLRRMDKGMWEVSVVMTAVVVCWMRSKVRNYEATGFEGGKVGRTRQRLLYG